MACNNRADILLLGFSRQGNPEKSVLGFLLHVERPISFFKWVPSITSMMIPSTAYTFHTEVAKLKHVYGMYRNMLPWKTYENHKNEPQLDCVPE